MNILFFASVAEVAGIDRIEISGPGRLSELKTDLEEMFPEFVNMKYTFAVNQEICHDDKEICEQDEIALLPPFSGG